MSAAIIGVDELREGSSVEHLDKPAVREAPFVQGSMSAPYPKNVMATAEAGLTGRERASRAAADCVQQDGSEMIARALVVSAWRRESICELSRGWRRHTRYGRVAWGRLTQIKPSETRGRKASFGIVLSEAV